MSEKVTEAIIKYANEHPEFNGTVGEYRAFHAGWEAHQNHAPAASETSVPADTITKLATQLATANRLLLFVERGDANMGYFGNDDWVVAAREKQAAGRKELDEYVSGLSAALTGASSASDDEGEAGTETTGEAEAWLVSYAGGIGDKVWDAELTITANSCLAAVAKAAPIVEQANGEIYAIEAIQ